MGNKDSKQVKKKVGRVSNLSVDSFVKIEDENGSSKDLGREIKEKKREENTEVENKKEEKKDAKKIEDQDSREWEEEEKEKEDSENKEIKKGVKVSPKEQSEESEGNESEIKTESEGEDDEDDLGVSSGIKPAKLKSRRLLLEHFIEQVKRKGHDGGVKKKFVSIFRFHSQFFFLKS